MVTVLVMVMVQMQMPAPEIQQSPADHTGDGYGDLGDGDGGICADTSDIV